MRTLTEQLTKYASYHRDRRNIATHFVGIPMIVFGVATLLAKPAFYVGGIALSPAFFASLGAILYYFVLDVRFGVAMTAFMGAAYWTGMRLALGSTGTWIGYGLALFVLGWVIQFIGHYYEGKKPAFVDDLAGFIIGPLFIVAEAAFALGLRKDLVATIEAKVGPTITRDLSKKPATA